MTRLLVTLAWILAADCAGPSPGPALAQDARATLVDASGATVGEVELVAAPAGGVLLVARLANLPPGIHGFHIHRTGACEPPSFDSAGGHFNPHGDDHGVLAHGGRHAGDLPNLHVPPGGAVTIELFLERVTLDENDDESLLDADGSAVVIHANADDHQSQPAGEAGARIACGVIVRS